MPVKPPLLNAITSQPPAEAWACIAAHLQDEFFAPISEVGAESEIVRRDRGLAELDDVLSGSAWDLWTHFEGAVPGASKGIVESWTTATSGKAVLILDGLSLREAPWLLAGSSKVEERCWLPDVAARWVVATGSVRAVPRTLEMMEYTCGSEQRRNETGTYRQGGR